MSPQASSNPQILWEGGIVLAHAGHTRSGFQPLSNTPRQPPTPTLPVPPAVLRTPPGPSIGPMRPIVFSAANEAQTMLHACGVLLWDVGDLWGVCQEQWDVNAPPLGRGQHMPSSIVSIMSIVSIYIAP